ncbi:oxidoreductase [Sphingomonas sp. Leaf33]|uniref:Gfo/Idh/MocA family protein n=1 Tax=Sphingomonas sp. Leaf33 TaxID=1736215 RepID=UPI0006FB274E|nr:Gfo/Idh/MocA family oxidoreductase [Sphingomonas sp. Leaf33]KQN24816.1 oxidoreductase [Sphingomonas sp. Leaf33]
MHAPIRWGMIGCGDVTERKSGPAYRLAAGSMLAAVAARRPEAAADYARRHGVPRVFDDIAAMIRSPDIDAVYVATPPDSHADYALAVAAAGKPCCVEKPIAPSLAEAQRMVAAFEAAGQPLFVAYYRRALPRFDQVRDWLARGAIGAVRHIHWTLTRPARPPDSGGWRTVPEAAPGGYFDDLACHGLDLFDDLLGPIVAAAGHRHIQSGVGVVPDAVAASWRHHSGTLGSGIWNFAADHSRDTVTIIGDRGEIDFAIFDGGAVTLRADGTPIDRAFDDPDPVQLHHVERMTAQLLGGPAYAATGVAAARTAWVMDAILASGVA